MSTINAVIKSISLLAQLTAASTLFATGAMTESGAGIVGDWNLSDGRTVTARDDRTAEILDPATGASEAVGEWRQESTAGGNYVFMWKDGDRHVMKISDDGGTLQGMLHSRGRLAGSPISAGRAEEEETASFFGSSSPSGNVEYSEEEVSMQEDENEPPAMEEDDYAQKTVAEDPVERTETQARLLAQDARLSGSVQFESSKGNIGNWQGEGSSVSWSVAHLKPGKYNLSIEHSVGMGKHGGRFEISTGSAKASSLVRPTGGWKTFKRKPLGSIEIAEDDAELTFTITDVQPGAYLMNVQSVELRRQ